MTLLRHEIRKSLKSLLIWTLSIGLFIALCVFLYPEIREEMDGVSDMFASMGAFSQAFGMDRLNMGTLIGFYAVECGTILGLGGAFFAALTGASALSKEEQDRTAEFLLVHPLSRRRVITGKLVAVMLLVALLNLLAFLLALFSILAIGEAVPWRELLLLHAANLLMQLEVAGLCFGLSAFLRRGAAGAGLGVAAGLYFLNITANITEKAEVLKFFTPFAYTDGADILSENSLNAVWVLLGILYAVLAIGAAYWNYSKKDIHCG